MHLLYILLIHNIVLVTYLLGVDYYIPTQYLNLKRLFLFLLFEGLLQIKSKLKSMMENTING